MSLPRHIIPDDPQESTIREETHIREIPLERIRNRANQNGRPLNPSHVKTLKESIQLTGFTTSITVDKYNHLISGAHRLEALRELKRDGWDGRVNESICVDFSKIPCKVTPIDSEHDPILTAFIEFGENAIRKNFSPEEFDHLVGKLVASGYEFSNGRVEGGKKSISMVLKRVLNLNDSKISRLLAEYKNREASRKRFTLQEDTDGDVRLGVGTAPVQESQEKKKGVKSISFAKRICKTLDDIDSEVKGVEQEELDRIKGDLSDSISEMIQKATHLLDQLQRSPSSDPKEVCILQTS